MDDFARLLGGFLAPVLADGFRGFLSFFWYFAFFEFPRYVLTDLLVLLVKGRKGHRPKTEPDIPYTVVMPALNEAETIGKTLHSLAEQSHQPHRIIVVNDGSTDATDAVCRQHARSNPKIRYIDQGERAGKSASLNRGLGLVETEVVVFIDSDTTFDRDAMRALTRRFWKPGVVAVGGSLRVRNRSSNLLSEMQALEYGISIFLGRQAKALMDILPIISGAFGAFRTSAVRSVGGHDPGPGNDSDLTIDLRNLGGSIDFAEDAVCHTDVPTKLPVLTRQRRRWCRNVVKNRIRKHLNLFSPFSLRFDARNLISTLDPLVYQVVFSWAWAVYMVDTVMNRPELLAPIALCNFGLYFMSQAFQQMFVILLSERPREDLRGVLFLPAFHLYRVYLRLVMMYAQLEELCTRKSLRDPFAPPKVQRAQPDW